jgi:hypothetical protein
MGPPLEITDLRTSPERTYSVLDVYSRSRVQIVISAEPALAISHHCAARMMTALIAHLAGYPFPDINCELVMQPLGLPASEVVTQYLLAVGQDPTIGAVTLSGSFDAALDGDAPDWKPERCDKTIVLKFGGALQLWLNLNLPE